MRWRLASDASPTETLSHFDTNRRRGHIVQGLESLKTCTLYFRDNTTLGHFDRHQNSWVLRTEIVNPKNHYIIDQVVARD
jgi:hypothetical protein